MKKTLLLFTAFLTMALVSAQTVGETFTDNGINYVITSAFPDADEVGVTGMAVVPATVMIPASVNDPVSGFPMAVVSVEDSAFNQNKDVTEVQLPSTVRDLKRRAFRQTNLEKINLENVETTNAAFESCGSLTDIGTYDNLVDIGRYTFWQCSALEIVIPAATTTIGLAAFGDHDGLINFNIPRTVNDIGEFFMGRCDNLVALKLNWEDPATEHVILANNFFRDIDLTLGNVSIYVPINSKGLYEAHAVWGQFPAANIIEGDIPASTIGNTFTVAGINYTVTSDDPKEAKVSGVDTPTAAITVPLTATDPSNSEVYNITSIGGGAFLADATLTTVVLPTSVTLLSTDAFSGCVNLETINLENIVTIETQNVFFDCPKLTTANLAAATSIGNFAFHNIDVGDNVLSSISIPSMVTIGGSSFRTSNISSIDIPATVTSIGSRAFRDCMSLTAIQVNWAAADIPVLVADVFENLTASGITLYVPTGTSADYAAALVWQDFTILEGTLSASSVEKALGFSMYPNPTNGVVSIRNKQLNNASITVYDLNGRALLSKELNSTESEINISNLSNGLYIFRVQTENGEFAKRIIKQ